MKPITKILVPTDFSANADGAIERALDFAGRFGASLELFHVYELPVVYAEGFALTPQIVDSIRSAAEANLAIKRDQFAQRARDAGGPPIAITSKIAAGATAATIVDEAAAGAFDLIVMGTHGRTGVSRFFLGSIAERVVRTAGCAVLTVRAEKESTSAAA